jgi:hypothetical protein
MHSQDLMLNIFAQQIHLKCSLAHVVLRADYEESKYHMSWDYHVVMTSLVLDYSTIFHTTSHSDSYYYRD